MSILKGAAQPIGGSSGGGGTTVNTGSAILDFGAFPGSNEAQVVVTGQGSINSTSFVQATFKPLAIDSHTVNDHAYAQLLTTLSFTDIVDGVGFTITARSTEKLQGRFNVNWTWL